MTTTNAQIKKFEKEFLKEKGYGSIRYEDRYEWASFISQKSAETEKLRKAEPIFLQEFEKSIRASECQRVARKIFEELEKMSIAEYCGAVTFNLSPKDYQKLREKYGVE